MEGELAAPVVGVVGLAALGVVEEEAVLGGIVSGAGGELPPKPCPVGVAAEMQQAGERAGAGPVGEMAVGTPSDRSVRCARPARCAR